MSVLTDLRQLRGEVETVLAKHESAKSVADFAKYADDPAGFMREVLRCEPIEMQVQMAERVRDHTRTIVVTANALGKDWVTARIAFVVGVRTLRPRHSARPHGTAGARHPCA